MFLAKERVFLFSKNAFFAHAEIHCSDFLQKRLKFKICVKRSTTNQQSLVSSSPYNRHNRAYELFRSPNKSPTAFVTTQIMTFLSSQDHLVCFLPGTMALGASLIASTHPDVSQRHMKLAKDIMATCRQMYANTPTGLSPEITYFNLVATGTNDLIVKVRSRTAACFPRCSVGLCSCCTCIQIN